MTALVEQPTAFARRQVDGRAPASLLAPVILEPGPRALMPQGCLYLPSMKLIVAGASGPVDLALVAAERIARARSVDVLVVSIRPSRGTNAIRFDAMFVEGVRTELFSDLLFWTLPERMPAFVPRATGATAVIIGRSTLIPSDAMPYVDRAERAAGIARGTAEQRLSLWGEE